MIILGINDSHNASACLLNGGRLVAAIQEERLRRVKNWSGFPAESIRWVLDRGGVPPERVDAVAFNGRSVEAPAVLQKLRQVYRLASYPLLPWIWQASRFPALYARVSRPLRQRGRRQRLGELGIPTRQVVFVDHHLAHAASAYFGWGCGDGPVLVLTADGSGDGLCATVSIGAGGRLERLAQTPTSASLGGLYALATLLLGMNPAEHEHKVMGLAGYAPDGPANNLKDRLDRQFVFTGPRQIAWRRAPGHPDIRVSYGRLKRLLDEYRFDAAAGGVQAFLEVWLCAWVQHCVRATGVRRVSLAGGVFMNVKANLALSKLPCIDDLFVFPSCGDETGAIGAAWWVHFDRTGEPPAPLEHLYLGPDYTGDQVRAALRQVEGRGWSWERPSAPERETARLLAQGKILARFQGRMEFGARALGNRSILAHPGRPELIQRLNRAVKQRDFWMPFAPAILDRRAQDYLINPKELPAPYMILAFDTTPRSTEIMAAVHPWDHTARPQVVTARHNPAFYRLIEEFESLTGCGAVLNTSFNLHGEPIVMSPAQALDVFGRSGLNFLLLQDFLIWKNPQAG